MSDFPDKVYSPNVISTFQRFSGAAGAYQLGAASFPASNNWPAANQAIFCPMQIPFYYKVANVWWVNGATLANMDFGIYTLSGSRIFSTGSTAGVGASSLQQVATTLLLSPGSYYFGLASDGTTSAMYSSNTYTTNEGRLAGLLQQASAFPLPATATFAQWASTGLPLCGISR